MRVLMVFHAAPCSPGIGPARRHLHLLEEVASRHDVTVITLAGPGQRERFEREHGARCARAIFIVKRPRVFDAMLTLWYACTGHGQIRRAYSRRVQRAIDRVASGQTFDVVYVSTVLLGCYRLPRTLPSIGDAHNVEHEVFARAARIAKSSMRKAYYRLQSVLTRRDERRLSREFSAVWATSDRDAAWFAEWRGDEAVAVVPNGVRVAAPAVVPPVPASRELVLLYVGTMSYFPNADAAEYFLDEIAPLIAQRVGRARTLIVGANPPARLKSRASPTITVTGEVADVAPYYGHSSVFVVPLRAGGGTRQKVLEAMRYGIPVVSTTLGCEGLDVRDGDSVLLADTPEDFADKVAQVWRDRALAERLTHRAFEVIRAEYDWSRIGERVDAALMSAASNKGAMIRTPVPIRPQTLPSPMRSPWPSR
jgi:polysaccharide biosynthesis protein PslH